MQSEKNITLNIIFFPLHQVMGTVKMAVVNALMAGKVIDVNAPHQRNTVWTQMDCYAVGGGLAYVENANALMTEALGLCVNTALNVAIPLKTTGTVCIIN